MLKTRAITKITNTNATNYGQFQGVLGQGKSNFIYGADALAQILTHQLLSIRGEITNKINFGVNWFADNTPTTTKNMFDIQIQTILNENIYVKSIMSFKSEYSSQTNTYSAKIKVDTTEGLLNIVL